MSAAAAIAAAKAARFLVGDDENRRCALECAVKVCKGPPQADVIECADYFLWWLEKGSDEVEPPPDDPGKNFV